MMMFKAIFTVPPIDKIVIIGGNGCTVVLAAIEKNSGPAWLTACGTVFYLGCKGVAEIIKAKRGSSGDKNA